MALEIARKKRFQWKLQKNEIATPHEYGQFELTPSYDEIVELIDWSPFFWTWGLKGSYPSILEKQDSGDQAKTLLNEAREWLKKIHKAKFLKPKVRVGFFKAQSEDESVFIFDDIYWSPEMTEAWNTIKENEKVTLTLDIFQMGIVFFRKEQTKQHFTLKY